MQYIMPCGSERIVGLAHNKLPAAACLCRSFSRQSYFYNTHSQTRQDDKPAGYIRCLSCQTQLASRRCTVEERDLCFVCYRQEHLEGNERYHCGL